MSTIARKLFDRYDTLRALHLNHHPWQRFSAAEMERVERLARIATRLAAAAGMVSRIPDRKLP